MPLSYDARSVFSLFSMKYMGSCPLNRKDVLIVGRLDVDGQSFAPIGLHKIDAVSDWLLVKRHCIGTKGLPEVQVQN